MEAVQTISLPRKANAFRLILSFVTNVGATKYCSSHPPNYIYLFSGDKMKFLLLVAILTFSYNPPALAADPTAGNVIASPPAFEAADNTQLFWFGIAAMEKGQLSIAAAAFRAILENEPNHFPARRALVDCLIMLDNTAAAELHLTTLLKADPDIGKQGLYQRILGELTEKEPLRFSGSFAVLPSSNVNHGTRNRVFDSNIGEFVIDDSGRETSGVGIRLGGNGTYSWPLSPGRKISLRGDLSSVWYESRSLRHLDGEARLSYHAESTSDNFELGAYFRNSWYLPPISGQRSDLLAPGVLLSYVRQVSSSDSIGIHARYENQTFIEKSYLSGRYQSVKIKWGHQLSPNSQTYLIISSQLYQPEAKHPAYEDVGFEVGFNNRWNNGWAAGINLGTGVRNFTANFPALSFPREDNYYSLGVSIQTDNFEMLLMHLG
jgi:hypothetical protein